MPSDKPMPGNPAGWDAQLARERRKLHQQELGDQAQAEFARQEVLVQEAAVAAVAHFTDAETALRVVAVLKRQRLLAARIN